MISHVEIAEALHNATRLIPRSDGSMPKKWSELDGTQRSKAIQAVQKVMATQLSPHGDRACEQLHDIWALQMVYDGWKYGEEYDAEAKTHPDLQPYFRLKKSVQDKDLIWYQLTEIYKAYD